jgi:hypothetical protein
VKYTPEQQILLYDTYIEKKNCVKVLPLVSSCVPIPPPSVIFKLVKKVCSTESFLDKKYTRQIALLTEEKLDKIKADWTTQFANPWHSLTHTGFNHSSTESN